MILDFFHNIALSIFMQVFTLVPDLTDNVTVIASYFSHVVYFIEQASYFVPMPFIGVIIGNIVFWLGINLLISAIKFILDFIPLW